MFANIKWMSALSEYLILHLFYELPNSESKLINNKLTAKDQKLEAGLKTDINTNADTKQ